jgi:hypothetical protein
MIAKKSKMGMSMLPKTKREVSVIRPDLSAVALLSRILFTFSAKEAKIPMGTKRNKIPKKVSR